MKVNPQAANLTLPVPSGTEPRTYRTSSPARACALYDGSGVIDTVQIPRGNVQAASANMPMIKPSLPHTGKGVYIDLWA